MRMLQCVLHLIHNSPNFAQSNALFCKKCDKAQFHKVCEADSYLPIDATKFVVDYGFLFSCMPPYPHSNHRLRGAYKQSNLWHSKNARLK